MMLRNRSGARGTDCAFDMGDYDPHEFLESLKTLSENERAAILGGNARQLLGLEKTR